MTLRRHQADLAAVADGIAQGSGVRDIFAAVTPGGGKSALPGILADRLIGPVVDRILWVVPRNSLRDQGERDFPDWSRYRIRSAGNEVDPCRGTAGYVTTYQAIASDPARHLETVSASRWAVILDEPHHVLEGGAWHRALDSVLQRASVRLFMSGTFSRGDGAPIAHLQYDGAGRPLFDRIPHTAAVRYSRTDALRESAIVPIRFSYLDGRAEWEDETGARQEAEISSGDYTAQALFTALRTDYAYELLDEATTAWRGYRRDVYPAGKFLVVAHDIDQAKLYQAHLHRRGVDALIATSEDDARARDAIARFKGLSAPATDALVTVAMAYEGLSVPAISHVACLTHIRSVPWLEQCFARANRTALGKREGFIYGPKDVRFLSAIRAIEAEQVLALNDQAEREDKQGVAPEVGQGEAKPWITPIGSEAYRAVGERLEADEEKPDGGLTPKEAERLLRTQIADHIAAFLATKRHGSKQLYSKLLHRKLKDAVDGKAREDCTVAELTTQFLILKEEFPI